jgi:hypothetical protein
MTMTNATQRYARYDVRHTTMSNATMKTPTAAVARSSFATTKTTGAHRRMTTTTTKKALIRTRALLDENSEKTTTTGATEETTTTMDGVAKCAVVAAVAVATCVGSAEAYDATVRLIETRIGFFGLMELNFH